MLQRRRNDKFSTLLLVLSIAALLAERQGFAAETTGLAQEIEAAETAFTTGLATVDIPKLERLLTNDFTWTHTTGAVERKTEYLKGVQETRRYKKFQREGTTFHIYEKAAVSAGNLHMTVSTEDRGERVLHIRYTAVYVLQDGGWRLAAWHNTRLAE